MAQPRSRLGAEKTRRDVSPTDVSPQSLTVTENRSPSSPPSDRRHSETDNWLRRDRSRRRRRHISTLSKIKKTVSFELTALASFFVLSALFVASVDACNESICASIVSKCTLLRSCDCDIEPTGCSCCKKCFACLEFLQARTL
jgi:hypothetical protein